MKPTLSLLARLLAPLTSLHARPADRKPENGGTENIIAVYGASDLRI